MLKKAVMIVIALCAAFVIVIMLQPSNYHVERTTTIAAPAALVFGEVNDLHRWEQWSPWAKLDPKAKVSFAGPEAGEGAIFRWAGNQEVGEGSMTILESLPDERIKIKTEFIKPFEGFSINQFQFKPDGDQTSVAWSIEGTNNFVGKAFCLFANMDTMLGDKLGEGLANLKARVEKQ